MRLPPLFAVLLSGSALLSGCGGDPAPASKSAPAPIERGVFISATDCAATGKLTLDQCGQAIDNAVAMHRRQGPSYKSLYSCAAAEGPDRCAQGVDGNYQPTLQAFFVTFGTPATAVPLYATSDGSAGFKGLDKQKFGLNDDGYTVSNSAQALAHENARLSRG